MEGDVILSDLVGETALDTEPLPGPTHQPEPEPEPELEPEPAHEHQPGPQRKRRRIAMPARKEYKWSKSNKPVASKKLPIFPQPNYIAYKGLPPKGLYELFITWEFLDRVKELSNAYALKEFGVSYNITRQELDIFFAILLLSGYCTVTDYELYWSTSEDCGNRMVKAAMPRDRFRKVKRSLHFGSEPDKEGATPDKYKKVRMLIKHMQEKFGEHFQPEQELSHDEAMIKYFGKHGLKQAIRNKPIRFGFKAWVLTTVSGYVVTFDLYQGKGVGEHHEKNVEAVGAAGATLLDLVDLLPEEKKSLAYHFFGDNFFSSMKLVEELTASGYFYTGTVRKDRLKGNPPLTTVDAFRKKVRGYHETAVLQDKSQIVVRWNDNAPVTMLSNCLGTEPIGTCKRWSRESKKRVDVPQPNVVAHYNPKMGGVDRFDQNTNHLRIKIGGKKWYYPIVTWILDAAVQNAWQLHKKTGGKLSALDFRREIVCIILKTGSLDRVQQHTPSGKKTTPGWEELRYDNIGHLPISRPELHCRCAYDGCNSRSRFHCIKCERAICMDHFIVFHTGTA